MERGVDVRVRLASGMFGEGVVTGRRNFDVAYPVAGCFDRSQIRNSESRWSYAACGPITLAGAAARVAWTDLLALTPGGGGSLYFGIRKGKGRRASPEGRASQCQGIVRPLN